MRDTFSQYLLAHDQHCMIQIIIAFCIGILCAPWSWGLLYYLLFLIGYEIFLYLIGSCYWYPGIRLSIVISSFTGFIIGRITVGYENPLEDRKYIRRK